MATAESDNTQSPANRIFRIPELLADARTIEILCTLGGVPLQPAQIQQRVGAARSTMHARLRELMDVGLVSQRERERLPRSVEYALTNDGRVATARAVLTNRRQRRQLAVDAHEPSKELRDLLELIAPLSRFAGHTEGTCALIKRTAARSAIVVKLLARAGSLSSCEAGGQALLRAKIIATSAAWDDALLNGYTEELDISGDRRFAGVVLAALRATLR